MDQLSLPYSELDELRECVRFGYNKNVQSYILSLKAQDPTKSLSKYSCLLSEAIRYRHLHILDMLLSEGVPATSSAMEAAANAKSYEALAALFEHGWDINKPLGGSVPPVLSKLLDDNALVAWLLDQGADPNASSDIDETPLSYAVMHSNITTISLLLGRARDLTKGQIMHCAVDRQPSDLVLIQMLAERGAPVDNILWQDSKSYPFRGHFTRGTPLHRACKQNNVPVAEILLRLGANPDKMSIKDSGPVPPTPRDIANRGQNVEMMDLFVRAAGLRHQPSSVAK